jgi:hypothetical protein
MFMVADPTIVNPARDYIAFDELLYVLFVIDYNPGVPGEGPAL